MSARNLFLTTLLLFVAYSSSAELGQWASWGPPGGWVRSVAVDAADPEILYLGTQTTFFRSEDGGQSWEESSRNLGARVQQILTAPGTPSTVYVLADGDVYRSNQRGKAWRKFFALGSGIELAVAQRDPRRLLLTTTEGLYRSMDRARTWQKTAEDTLGGLALFDLAIDTQQPDRVYLVTGGNKVDGSAATGGKSGYATRGDQLWRSIDGGVTWRPMLSGDDLRAVDVGPARRAGGPGAMYAGSADRTLHRSFSGGATWETLPGLLPSSSPLDWLRAHPHQAGVLYASFLAEHALYHSDDHGETWTRVSAQTRPAFEIAFDTSSPETLYLAAGLDGFGVSTDAGQRWAIGEVVSAWDIGGLAPDPRSMDGAFAVVDQRPFLTTDGGVTWQQAQTPGLSGVRFLGAVARDHDDPDLIWAADLSGLVRSTDGGFTWSARPGPVGTFAPYIFEIVQDPRGARRLWLAAHEGLYHYDDVGPNDDVGPTWTWIPLPAGSSAAQNLEALDLAVDPRNPDALWVVTGDRLLHSTDGGATWTVGGPSENRPAGEILFRVAIDPRGSGTLYVGSSLRVWRSVDGGTTWERWREELPGRWITGLAVDPATGAVYASQARPYGRGGGGVYRRAAGGSRWRPVGRLRDGIQDLGIERRDDRLLIWAGTVGRGLFRLERRR